MAERKFNTDSLEVDDDKEDEHSGEQGEDVWKILAGECFLEGASFVRASDEKMYKSNQAPFKLSATAIVIGVG